MRKIKKTWQLLALSTVISFSPLVDPIITSAFAQNSTYSVSSDPFLPSSQITSIASETLASSTNRAKLRILHSRLLAYFSGFPTVNSNLSVPIAANNGLSRIGDCSDRLNVVISAVNEINRISGSTIDGVVRIVHFDRSEPNVFHAFIDFNLGRGFVHFDPSSHSFGRLSVLGNYRIIRSLSFSEYRYLFHKEWGDYFLMRNDCSHAIEAYNRALVFYSNDPNLHQNLSVAYGNCGRPALATSHLNIANSIRP